MAARRMAAGAVATVAASIALCGSASAQSGHIYWASEGGDSIGRVGLDGTTGFNGSFISGAGVATDPLGVAINGTHIYWSHDEGAGGSIGRDTIAGSGSPTPTFIATNGDPQGVSLDATNVYWTHVSSAAGWVGRGSQSGFVPPVFGQEYQPTATTSQCGVAANGDRAFWANPGGPGSVGSAHGIDPEEQDYIPGAANDPCGVAIAGGGFVYWTNRGGTNGTIGRANLAGTGANGSFVDTGVAGSDPCGVAVTGEFIYWTDPVADDIGRADLDGSDPDPDFIDLPGGTNPCGIAVTPTQAVSPASQDYGFLTVGTESDPAPFSLENTASSVLDVTSVTLMGPDAAQFKLTGDGCTPARNSPGLNCFVNASYSPTAEGTHSAFLRVVSNASSSPTDIALTGTATPPPPGPDPTPAGDTEPPDTTITAGPPGKTKKKNAQFEFSSSEPGATFECRLDDGPFEACTSPKDYKVGKGKHSLEVRATDAAGNADPTPVTRSWTVKKRKPKK